MKDTHDISKGWQSATAAGVQELFDKAKQQALAMLSLPTRPKPSFMQSDEDLGYGSDVSQVPAPI